MKSCFRWDEERACSTHKKRKIEEKSRYLDADGSDDADLITITRVQVLRGSVVIGIPGIVLGFAARRYDRLGGQVDDVCEASVRKFQYEWLETHRSFDVPDSTTLDVK